MAASAPALSTESFRLALKALPKCRSYRIAFSGGVDSAVLLHLFAACRDVFDPAVRIEAWHVDHRLQEGSERWAEHCKKVCNELGIRFRLSTVAVENNGDGIEASARDARYQALMEGLGPADAVVLAHHLDDQAETMIQRLMRGAGLTGMTGMPVVGRRSGVALLRPLLSWTRASIEGYAKEHDVDWIEDPSNNDEAFDRNWLRLRLIPMLESRWPQATRSLVRTARQLSEANVLLDELAQDDLGDGVEFSPSVLSLEPLYRLAPHRQRNALRYWIRKSGFSMPPETRLLEVLGNALNAKEDANPLVAWQCAELRRYRGHFYLQLPLSELPAGWCASWNGAKPLDLPAGGGTLRWMSNKLPTRPLSVRFRQDGDLLSRPDGRGLPLKHWFQQNSVLPWMRERIPLVEMPDGRVSPCSQLIDTESMISLQGLFPSASSYGCSAYPELQWDCPVLVSAGR